MPLTVVIAPDSFKGTLSAAAVAEAIARGWLDSRPDDTVVLVPQADGGEGTIDALAAAIPGASHRSAGMVTGPDGRPTRGGWLALPGGTAVVELAGASGLPLMRALDPLRAQTVGLGEVVTAALDAGASSLVIGLGGSASTDGGAGALRALGLDLRDDHGAPVPHGGAGLARIASADRSELRTPPAGGVTLLTDVDAPLLGPRGAAALFGPQKGATADQVRELDAALGRFASVLGGDPGTAGAGAAGGTGYGFATVWDARLVGGADRIAALSGLDERMREADLVITGEGRFDTTSLMGKVVGQVMARAAEHGVRVTIIAGQLGATPLAEDGGPVPAWALVDVAGGMDAAVADPASALIEAGRLAAAHQSATGE